MFNKNLALPSEINYIHRWQIFQTFISTMVLYAWLMTKNGIYCYLGRYPTVIIFMCQKKLTKGSLTVL